MKRFITTMKMKTILAVLIVACLMLVNGSRFNPCDSSEQFEDESNQSAAASAVLISIADLCTQCGHSQKCCAQHNRIPMSISLASCKTTSAAMTIPALHASRLSLCPINAMFIRRIYNKAPPTYIAANTPSLMQQVLLI